VSKGKYLGEIMSSLFERAARCKLRFPSSKGQLSVEDLFDLNLNSLDNIAKNVNKQLKQESEESFIQEKSSVSTQLELQLDIVKHVISTKIATQEANKKRAETLAQKSQIQDILMRKQSQELENKSPEELQAMLNSLSV
jgi:hypothetical protein